MVEKDLIKLGFEIVYKTEETMNHRVDKGDWEKDITTTKKMILSLIS